MISLDIRPATPADAGDIKSLALDNQMYEREELALFDELLAGFYSGNTTGDRWLVAKRGHITVAAAYLAPEPFADRMWNLYFLATAPSAHGSGAGSTLLRHVEEDLRRSGPEVARTLIVDTSSTPEYQRTREFYRRRGFVEEARVRDFYGPDDHKVTFWKSLTGPSIPQS